MGITTQSNRSSPHPLLYAILAYAAIRIDALINDFPSVVCLH